MGTTSRWGRFTVLELLAMLYALYQSDIPIAAKLAYEIHSFVGMSVEENAIAVDDYPWAKDFPVVVKREDRVSVAD